MIGRLRAPWRSAQLGRAAACLALVAGVPLFVCLPPWNDVTLHDMAARSILRGGVHYRDVFDTNLPGIDWCMALIRGACGWSVEAIRIWDLLIVATSTYVLARLARQSEVSPVAIAWFAAAVALWYPFTSEFNHGQRDVWMLLPAAIAVALRASGRHPALEGFVWGLAVWFKPHVLIPAAAVWLVSLRFREGRRLRDLGGLLLGGGLAGSLGVLWLIRTGAWPWFLDTFTRWNPEYISDGILQTVPFKASYLIWCFQPWGFAHLAAIPLAALGLRRSEPPARSLLAALYLGWLMQVVFLQKPFDYVQAPAMLLAFAVLASRGWSVGFPFFAWFAMLGLMWQIPGIDAAFERFNEGSRYLRIERHPATDPQRMALWPRCLKEGSTPELRDRLGAFTHTNWGTNWENLHEVEQYLRTVDDPPGDRELTCWHDSTHPLYLSLGIEPSTRYMHFGTVFPLRGKLDEIRAEVIRSPQRYVVSDLLRVTRDPAKAYGPLEEIPYWLPEAERGRFPWNQPIVFRSGRYVVHRIAVPPQPEEIDIIDWSEVK